jgi:hypothetical protein
LSEFVYHELWNRRLESHSLNAWYDEFFRKYDSLADVLPE